jgi:3-oxoacyl-(acyl-carrier-protein) synthase
MRTALADAGTDASAIDAVVANASGLVEDAVEADAIARVFGAGKPVTSTRGATGHAAAASGALDAVVCAIAVDRGIIPATLGTTDTGGMPIEVIRTAREGRVDALMINAFSFGGQTASAVFRKCAN